MHEQTITIKNLLMNLNLSPVWRLLTVSLTLCVRMGKNARCNVYVVSMCKVMTSHGVICISHVSGLRWVVIYQCRTHFKIVTISIHSLLSWITRTVCDWYEELDKLFSWSIRFFFTISENKEITGKAVLPTVHHIFMLCCLCFTLVLKTLVLQLDLHC